MGNAKGKKIRVTNIGLQHYSCRQRAEKNVQGPQRVVLGDQDCT